MFGKKKGFTASQSKRMSRRMQSNMVGSHVVRQGGAARRKPGAQGASNVDFSNARRRSEANRGFVSHVGVRTTSGEDASAYSRRVSKLGYIEGMQRKARRKRIAFFSLAVLLVAVVAVGAGVAAYFGSSDSKLSLGRSNAADALVAAPAQGDARYLLCAAELGAASGPQGAASEAYLLVRIDPAARTLSFLCVPANLGVRMSDGTDHPLFEARALGGDAELIKQVSDFAGVGINHFVTTDAQGLRGMVEAVGGVRASLPEEVDDPRAGSRVLQSGEQMLDPEAFLVALRATNYADGARVVVKNRVSLSVALAQSALSAEGLSFAALVADAGDYIATDLTAKQLMDLGDSLRPLDNLVVYGCMPPGNTVAGGSGSFAVYGGEWSDMLARYVAGEDPNAIDSSDENVDPADVTVEVRNGAGATGAASRMGEMLKAEGYVVEGVGNVDDATTYPETLVIYKDPANEGAAKAVVRAGKGGRVINGGDFYVFETDILVIIGQDWMPVS